jgi:hypothetical protein
MTEQATDQDHKTTDLQQFFGTCFICSRRHDNLAYGERYQPLKWLCWPCLTTVNAKKAYHMTKRQLDQYERQALEDGGNAGGAYLDEIGKTDLAELTELEWATFWRTGFVAYSESMREIVSKEIPY